MIVKILLVVIISILLAVISACGMIVERSENTFVETYGDAQEKVFLQIENDLNEYHEGLSKIVEVIDSNWAFRLFFNDKKLDSKMTYRTLYEMDNVINRTATADLQDVSILMLGMNGKYYFRSGEILTWSLEEIKESEITREALENKDRVIYQYVDRGFTSMTSGHPVVMATKALCYKKSKEPYAIVYFMMKEKDMGRFYEYFTSEYSQFYMTDKQNRIVSSDQKKKLGGKMTDVIDLAELNSERTRSTIEREHQNVTVLRKHLPYYGYTIYGVIDSQEALRQFYNIPKLWIICILIAVSVIVITFFIVRQMTKPLSAW